MHYALLATRDARFGFRLVMSRDLGRPGFVAEPADVLAQAFGGDATPPAQAHRLDRADMTSRYINDRPMPSCFAAS